MLSSILTLFDVAPLIGSLYLLFSVFAYSNRCLNPFIYATQYEIVRRWWRVIVCRLVRGQKVESSHQMPPVVADGTGGGQQTAKVNVRSKDQ